MDEMADGAVDGLSVVILTFNSSASIGRTLRSVRRLSADIHVVDSFSSDDTVEICRGFGATVTQRAFSNYSDQRNWAIDNLPLTGGWQLHVDADEELEDRLVSAIQRLDLTAGDADGYILGRKIVFLGQVLRFGGIARTWHLRLFRTGYGRCEDRLYDQHFVGRGRLKRIPAFMLDHQEMSLGEWTARHNRWADMESAEALLPPETGQTGQVDAKALGTVIERKRYAKSRYYRLPLFWRATAYFLYRYILLLGFLDGRRGFIYHVLQGLWFRVLVDAKIYERQLEPRTAE